MNILLTGGTGLIGKALVEQLCLRNEQVTILTRSSSLHALSKHKNIKFITALSQLNSQEQFDAIINLAGEPIFHKVWSKNQKSILRESRLSLTTQLVEFINQYQQYPIFISGSATGIYGDQDEQTITETSKTAKTFTAQLCQDWENIARQANARVCLIRTGIVFSTKSGALAKMLPLYKWGLGGKLGNGEQYFPWIALEDMVNGILFLLDHSECRGAFNFSAPNPIKQHKFNRTLARILKRPAFATIPKWILHFMLGERANLLLESQNVVPEKLLNAGFQFQYSDCKNYLEDILKNK
ncbi:TPA: TIGR01777 family oxidoreductase [Haemophilus influenzae]|uniref:TIGR01777 family oxidoreductase n=1 Tax=Haemophilus TaxID=724 RepID=UPI000665D63C|nr:MULTISPECIES: TIGR01777 family oxidoreductase [Haemophilus]MCK8818293.1 TIGR01777 family oxidoreductase [Haemophilus influenzae]MCK8935188.1 TIGR01777 family oxidoreductase [Haemophilus influenzae]MCK8996045.1 TIGR01777 family oxidoreductase [Haemophilus influenzae]MCK9070200.1 TIGR01777 family oxidoreductase [Haemophilus influenzae]OFK52817.1 epimerase [Haemophilus sp. HMSC066A11]